MDPIQVLNTRRDELQTELDTLLETPTTENRSLNADEDTRFSELATEIRGIDDRVVELNDLAKRQADAAEARRVAGDTGTQRTQVTEPDIYVKGGPHSYFRDLGRRAMLGDHEAGERLHRHGRYETEQRALGNTGGVGGSGGEFAPPTFLVDQYVTLIKAKRVTADLFQHQDVPSNTPSVTVPRILSGTSVAPQTTQNTALANVDMTTGSVSTGWTTIGGRQIVSQQLLDQSAISFDNMIVNDLASSYALQVGTQIFAGPGNGTSIAGGINGLSNATVGSTVTWTQSNPTLAGFYGQTGKLLATFLKNRLDRPTHWVMNPLRWYWLVSASDPNGRPFVVPYANGNAYNPIASEPNGPVAMGPVGTMHGITVVIDPLVPANLGAGANQDIIYLLKADDLWLFESQPQSEAFRETYADQISVLFRLFSYVGTLLNRHPESIGTLTGTGLTSPAFAS